jgi:hypothetical protein
MTISFWSRIAIVASIIWLGLVLIATSAAGDHFAFLIRIFEAAKDLGFLVTSGPRLLRCDAWALLCLLGLLDDSGGYLDRRTAKCVPQVIMFEC